MSRAWSGLLSARSPWWFAGYQLVWLAAALGASSGLAWPGMTAAVMLAIGRLATGEDRGAASAVMAVSALVGLCLETAMALSGLVLHAAPWPSASVAPGWLVGLWLAFGATLPAFARLVGGWPIGGLALLGGIGAPFAYWGGARLGALTFAEPAWVGIIALALAWACILPGLLALQHRIGRSIDA